MVKPVAVVAGDSHYNLSTLKLADAANRMAITKANELSVPFIANGDTHDSKANLRGECVNAMIATFKTAKIKPYVNIGNHCKIHAKGLEHSLNFLKPYAHVIETPSYIEEIKSNYGCYIIPYHDDAKELEIYLSGVPPHSLLIMHQGVKDSNAGEYFVDHSAIDKRLLANFRTILSHYHTRQDINCKDWDKALGSNVTFGEANDPEKGFQILYNDGSLEFVPTNLRKHRVFEGTLAGLEYDMPGLDCIDGDLVWVKLKDKADNLNVTKEQVAQKLKLKVPFKLDLIPYETTTSTPKKQLQGAELMDSLIDSLTNTTDERKAGLKELWRNIST
jgi:hypothetical protein